MPEQHSWLLFHATTTPLLLLRPMKVSTSSELCSGFFWLHNFLDYPAIQFFDSPLTQPVGLHWETYHLLRSTSVTYRMPCHASGHQVLPTQPLPKKAEDFPRGGKHPKHVPLLTCLV